MQRCSIWTVSLAAALSLTGAAWAEHGGEGGHRPGGGHGTTPTFASHGESHSGVRDSEATRGDSHSGVRNSAATRGDSDSDGRHSTSASRASMNFVTRITNNPTLSARLLALLPSHFCASTCTTADLVNAAMGFRNQGQFIAALHVAKDLNFNASQLKQLLADMTAKGDRDSLGQALHEVDTALDAQTIKADVTLARQEAKTDLQAARAAKEAAEDAKEAAKEKAEDAKEAAKEKAEDAKEATKEAAEDAKEAAEEANEAAKTPTSGATTSSTTAGSQTRP